MKQGAGLAFFLVLIGLMVAVLAGHNFVRYYVQKDYPLHVFTACSPAQHDCFVADPSVADPTFQNGPYSKVLVTAAYAPACLQEHTCADFSCKGIKGCTQTYCSADALESGESCTSGAPAAAAPAATTTP